MLAKAVALSETNRTELIERTFYCAAAHFAVEVTVTSTFERSLKRRRIVPGERHEVDCTAKRECTVF